MTARSTRVAQFKQSEGMPLASTEQFWGRQCQSQFACTPKTAAQLFRSLQTATVQATIYQVRHHQQGCNTLSSQASPRRGTRMPAVFSSRDEQFAPARASVSQHGASAITEKRHVAHELAAREHGQGWLFHDACLAQARPAPCI